MSAADCSLAPKNLVVVIAGPTAAGKSDVAARICEAERGIIVSADSVQAYRGVQIGANKPSVEERQKTPHLLIDVADDSQCYNAAEWRADAIAAIQCLVDPEGGIDRSNHPKEDDVAESVISGRVAKGYSRDEKLLPVVCGGTMMYLQWLVHGAPDAIRPGEDAIEQARTTISEYQSKADFQGAVNYVSSFGEIFGDRIDGFSGEDWYRLRRTLEVALSLHSLQDKEEMAKKLYTGERSGGLDSLGYDVRCFFLCPDDRMGHTRVIDRRCEQMLLRGLLKETADLSLSGQMPDMAARAIGYRQSLEYLCDQQDRTTVEDNRFNSFVDNFTTATRRYAKKQMSWFRKDKDFMFIPVSISSEKSGGVDSSAAMIQRFCHMSREKYEEELYSSDGTSAKSKKENEAQGKTMKFYQFERHILKAGTKEYDQCLSEAVECRKRMLQNKKPRIDDRH